MIERSPALSILGVLLVSALPVVAAETPDVEGIVARTNNVVYYQGSDGKARVTMTIADAQGRKRVKEMTILRRDAEPGDANQKFYVYFHKPADERGMVFMVHKRVGAADDRWLYLPALDVQKRIAASDERTSFVGSNFLYEDVSGRGLDEDAHELVDVTDTYYVVKNTPKRSDEVEFDSYTMWIHKASFIPVEVKYEKGGEIYRVGKTLAVKEIQGHMTVTRSRMTDLRTGGTTLLDYSSVEYDVGLNDEIFTERYLRAAPRKYLE